MNAENTKDLSTKAKVVLAAMNILDAYGETKKVTSYAIYDIIIDTEDWSKEALTAEIDELELNDIIIDTNIKSINTLVAGLVRRGIVNKTTPSSITVDGTTRNLRQYFIKQ